MSMESPEEQAAASDYRERFLGPGTLDLLGVDTVEAITILNDWQRLGAETYVTDFTVKADDEYRHLIAKACIKFGPREAMAEWMQRRELIAGLGITVPAVFVQDGATIVEEFIPLSFKEAFAAAEPDTRRTLRGEFFRTYERLIEAGFKPMSLHDIRSHGDDVVLVDFGEDLGPAMAANRGKLVDAVEIEKRFRSMVGSDADIL